MHDADDCPDLVNAALITPPPRFMPASRAVAQRWSRHTVDRRSDGTSQAQFTSAEQVEIRMQKTADASAAVAPIGLSRPHSTLRFSADSLPRFATTSYWTTCPSLSVLRPARSTAEMCTNTSFPPPCG